MLVAGGGEQSRLAHVDANRAVLDVNRLGRGGRGSRRAHEQQEKPDFERPDQSSPPLRQSRFVGGNLGFVLEREPDFVQSFEQAMTGEFVDRKGGRKSPVVTDPAVLKI